MGIQGWTSRISGRREREQAQHITELENEIKILKADAASLERGLKDKDKRIADLVAELRKPSHELEQCQAEKEHLAASIGELEQAYGEYGLLFDTTVVFLKKIATGKNIRTDKPGGRELIEQTKALLLQYGHGEKPIVSE